ncbi:MAG: hypothetical protein GY862_02175 [Gammaproteobacteria bacterium]|nr:hypothetical protein [Gammaproteobacteria bacterium]
MPYVTSIERIGIKKGITKGILQKSREDVIEILRVRFKKIPKSLVKAIRSISDVALLSKLHRKAILAKSIKSVERRIEKESENSERKLNTVKTARYTHSVTPTFDSLTG